MKSTLIIDETQTLDFNFASNPRIANIGNSPMYVLTPEEEKTVDGLDLDSRNRVMASMYAIMPGEAKDLKKGVFRIILGVFCKAFLSYAGRIQTPKAEDETEPTTPTTPPATEPTAPANPEPTAPADPEPTAPADPEPTAPANPEPTAPADPEPTAPANPEPTV